ncbi:MAG: hypothetical protein J6Y03_00990 [Alphaproteobacteria bacterium]|nr:hypothetical protein [Alphaproteobacteria bacterium]
MSKKTTEQKMDEMTDEELENFKNKKIKSLFSTEFTEPFADMHRYSTVKVIIRAKEKLQKRAEAKGEKINPQEVIVLKEKLYNMMRYQPLSRE